MVDRLVHWLLETLKALGYPGIIALMAMESSILPVPSELVMPPAGYLVAKGELNAVLVLACGVIGSILGALVNYWIAHTLGRAFLRRFGKYVLISERALERSERYFQSHGEISTLIGRLIPVVRHLISIPAGLARMPLDRFVAFTGIGALVWCAILTGIGYFLGQHEAVLQNEDVRRSVTKALLVMAPIVVLGIAWYVVRFRRRRVTSPSA